MHLQQLHQSIIAIAFLGTPHRGSAPAQYGAALARIARYAGARINTKLVEVLRSDSEVLAIFEDSFWSWLRNNDHRFEMTCFYEELELLAPFGLIVPRESAVFPGRPTIQFTRTTWTWRNSVTAKTKVIDASGQR